MKTITVKYNKEEIEYSIVFKASDKKGLLEFLEQIKSDFKKYKDKITSYIFYGLSDVSDASLSFLEK